MKTPIQDLIRWVLNKIHIISSSLLESRQQEVWTKTFFSDNYEVSSTGRVRSLDRYSANGRPLKGMLKKIFTDGAGYPASGFCINGKQKMYAVHQVVFYSFNGGSPSGFDYIIDHIDGEPRNNNITNLQLISPYENILKGRSNKYNLPKFISARTYPRDKTKLVYRYSPYIKGQKKRKELKNALNLDTVIAYKEKFEKENQHLFN